MPKPSDQATSPFSTSAAAIPGTLLADMNFDITASIWLRFSRESLESSACRKIEVVNKKPRRSVISAAEMDQRRTDLLCKVGSMALYDTRLEFACDFGYFWAGAAISFWYAEDSVPLFFAMGSRVG